MMPVIHDIGNGEIDRNFILGESLNYVSESYDSRVNINPKYCQKGLLQGAAVMLYSAREP